MRETLKLARSRKALWLVTATWAAGLLWGCRPETSVNYAGTFVAREFADGRVEWTLVLPSEDWLKLSNGEPLDLQHQSMSNESMRRLDMVIRANMDHYHLCQTWTLTKAVHYENALTFFGQCISEMAVHQVTAL